MVEYVQKKGLQASARTVQNIVLNHIQYYTKKHHAMSIVETTYFF